jgi:hypothetical protein
MPILAGLAYKRRRDDINQRCHTSLLQTGISFPQEPVVLIRLLYTYDCRFY